VALPDSVSDFRIGDVVAGNGFEAALYRDGLFTFSLTRWEDELVVEGADESGVVELGPGRTLLAWRSGGGTFVMIGDLPPDLRASVVSELPAPDAGGLFRRLWNRLFG
jgi:negative regulator of sigma E activity